MATILQAIFSSSLILLTLVLADATNPHPHHGGGHHAGGGHHVHSGGGGVAHPQGGNIAGGNTASMSHGFAPGPWRNAHATFYGEADGSGTFVGACGYDEHGKDLYGTDTAALSVALFNNGETCGACYEIKCVQGTPGCKPGDISIFITGTNLCPAGGLGWCAPPNEHFDLSMPAYLKMAEYKAGIVAVQYRRVPCKRRGGIKFKITGNPYFNLVSVMNVGGAGDVTKVEVKTGADQWTALKRNWGQKWETNAMLVGHDLTFRITTSDGRTIISEQAAPSNWQFNTLFEGKNFM